jgi:transmembrane sensor
MNDKHPPMTGTPKEQAGYWIVRQNSGNWSKQDSQAFRLWLAESHEHRLAFEQVQGLWQGLDQFKETLASSMVRQAQDEQNQHFTVRPEPAPLALPLVVEGLNQRCLKAITTLPLDKANQRRRRFQPQRWVMGGLCAAVLIIGLIVIKFDSTLLIPSEQTYATTKGQQTTITLADGSEIDLNTDTQLKVQFNPLRRLITLNHGEASFKVAHQTLRGFTVKANSGEIQDIGTQFNVNVAPEQVVITVTEGAVRVQTKAQNSPPLIAGQRLSYNAKGIISLPDRPDLAAVTAWQHGQVVFDMTPLSDATEQLSRYHQVKFIFDDPKLKRLKMSGTFNTQDLPVFLSTLENIYPLRAQRGNDQTVHLKMARR